MSPQTRIFELPSCSMTSVHPLSPGIVCAENIAFLHFLHSVPLSPSSNQVNDFAVHKGGYVLSLTRERDLVSALAFLSTGKDDPNHVPAICVKEDHRSSSLSVLLAVNRTNREDGNQVLQKLKQGFEEIFAILSELSEQRSTAQDIEDRVFTVIVSMCSLRILCRLRFTLNNRKIPKQPIKSVLEEAMSALGQLSIRQLGRQLSTAKLFVERAKVVVKLIDAWTKHQTPARLKELVEGAHYLGQIELQALVDIIPNQAMCPSSRENLVNTISKVSRYREAARFLYRIAKRFPLVQRMKVVLVNLPQEAFQRVETERYTPSLESTLRRISGVHRLPDLSHLCRLLNTNEPKAKEKFATQTMQTLKKAKIHAEIQLIFYWERNASGLPPRVICSSKDACFLCNAFILMHGKIYMPRYHGKLYPGWRLPLIPQLNDIEQRLNSVLENQARNSLKTLLARNQKTVYPDPNESTLLTLPISTSTLRTLVLPEVTEREIGPAQASLEDEAIAGHDFAISTSTRVSAISSEKVCSADSALDVEAATAVVEKNPETDPSNQDVSQLVLQDDRNHREHSPHSMTDDNGKLIEGRKSSNNVAVDYKTRLYTLGPFEIYLEYATNTVQVSAGDASKDPGYGIEWLSAEEARALLEEKTEFVIDVEALQGETSHEVDDQNCLFLKAHGAVVKIFRS